MSPASHILLPLMTTLCLVFSGCTALEGMKRNQEKAREARANAELREEARTRHAAFRAEKNWRSRTYADAALLSQATPENVSLEIALGEQRGFLLVRTAIAMDFPVSSGKKSHPTPTGSYHIRGKEMEYRSNLYGKVVDAEGVVLEADADSRKHSVPEGGAFVGSPMPYWMRLTDSGVGLHVGYVPGGRGASHGCIRLKRATAAQVFRLVKVGTPVVIAQNAPALSDAPTKRR